MSVQSINNAVAPAVTAPVTGKDKTNEAAVNTAAKESNTGFDETAVIYEKSPAADTSVTVKNSAVDREALIAQMKADTEARMNQLTDIVHKMMGQQGQAIGLADDMWKFLAKGDFEVSAEVKAQAQADIAEDGYWGVEQTSDRILDFAKALSGGDADKADELLEAFKEGFAQATKSWGQDLPELSQRTYKAVEEKFAAWKEGAQKPTESVPAEKPEAVQQPAQTQTTY